MGPEPRAVGVIFSNTSTAVGEVIQILTYVSVTVNDLGGRNGVVQVYADRVTIGAMALRQMWCAGREQGEMEPFPFESVRRPITRAWEQASGHIEDGVGAC